LGFAPKNRVRRKRKEKEEKEEEEEDKEKLGPPHEKGNENSCQLIHELRI